MRTVKVLRDGAVATGLIVGGSGLGGAFGLTLLGTFGFVIDRFIGVPVGWKAHALANVVGSVAGGLLGPLLAWTALAELPLRRTCAHTVGGALLGGVVGFAWSNWNPALLVGGATLGMIVGALELRLRMRTRSYSAAN